MISIISLAAADKRPETHEASSLLVSVKLRELPVGSLTCKAAGMQWWWGRGGGGASQVGMLTKNPILIIS